jgi:glycerol uptake facilitator-like aquaporin
VISPAERTVWRRALAEAIGTGVLVAAVIGSGIAAQRLSPHDAGLELLENALATGAALITIILVLAPVSGAQLNPVVSVVEWRLGGISGRDLVAYVLSQVAGGAGGAVVANLMYGLPAVSIAVRPRWGGGVWLAEVVATAGLVLTVSGLGRSRRAAAVPAAVGAYIAGAYFFTSSTSFANPAVTLARMLSNTFAGIGPASVPPFVAAELVGGLLGWLAVRALFQAEPGARRTASVEVIPADDAVAASA